MMLSVFLLVICCVGCESFGIIPVSSFLGPRIHFYNRRVNADQSKIVQSLKMEKLGELSMNVACPLPIINSVALSELYDKLRNPFSHSVDTILSTLNSLKTVNVYRKSIPDDVVKSIAVYVSGIRDGHDYIAVVHSLCLLKFDITDFDKVFLGKFQTVCESTLKHSPKDVLKVLDSLECFKFNNNSLNTGFILAVDKALAELLKDSSEIKCSDVLTSLGYIGFKWSSLSDETRVGLQHAMHREIPQMNAVQFDELLTALDVLKVKYFKLPIVRDSIIVHIDRCLESIDIHKLFNFLGHADVPWYKLTLPIKAKLEPLFIEFFKSNQLDRFKGMNLNVSDESSELLKEFISVEVSKHLDKLNPEMLYTALKTLTHIRIKWSMFNTASQQQLLNIINRQLPQYIPMATLIGMEIPYNQLSEDLKRPIQQHVIKIFETPISWDCNRFDSLSKMGFKYALMSEDAKKLLQTKLVTFLPSVYYVPFQITLVDLSCMGVTSSDLSEELHQCIVSLLVKHKTDFDNLPSKYKELMFDSLNAIFKNELSAN